MTIFEVLRMHQEWSRDTFGPTPRTVGITKHIEKECEEIRAVPHDREEWIDILILAWDGYWRAGGSTQGLTEDLRQKVLKIFQRRYPPGPYSDDELIEHVR